MLTKYRFLFVTGDFHFFIKLYVLISAISMYFTLPLPYVGEEGVYTISAMEMFYHSNYAVTTMYGAHYFRPPLLNWLIIPLANMIGWHHILIASRFINATATILTGFMLFYLVAVLARCREFAWLCLAAYYTTVVTMWLGWLAYADSVMSFFIMASITMLWIAIEKKRSIYLFVAVLAICCGFLTKAFTPYVFYATAGLVLLLFHRNRWFLLNPLSWLLHIFALFFPWLFEHFFFPGLITNMLHDVSGTYNLLASWATIPKYLYQIILEQPIQLFFSLMPFSVVIAMWLIKKRKLDSKTYIDIAKIAFWVSLLAFIPCWFSYSHWPERRYYLPVIPFMGITMAYVIWNGEIWVKRISVLLLMLFMLVNLLLSSFGFYIYYSMARPAYQSIAKQILEDTQGAPLTVYGVGSAESLSITSAIDSQLMPDKILPYGDKVRSGYCYTLYDQHTFRKEDKNLFKEYRSTHSKRTYFLTRDYCQA